MNVCGRAVYVGGPMGTGARRQKNKEMLCSRKLQQCALEGLAPGEIRH